jgi:hypothetical protein
MKEDLSPGKKGEFRIPGRADWGVAPAHLAFATLASAFCGRNN